MARKKNYPNKLMTYEQLMVPTLQALMKLGGSGTIEEINETVYQVANIPAEQLAVPHDENGLHSEIDYRIAWARTYLKKFGLIDNSSRGVWSLTKSNIDTSQIDGYEIARVVREANRLAKPQNKPEITNEPELSEPVEEAENWKDSLLNVLLNIPPASFERLAQRLLRESGFVQVEVTGKSGDGGIDGKGIVRISGFLSFHILFQCKRYKGSISPSQIRDFRGAMQGRADKGLFITTGTFTREAIKEATRDGAPPIDLIDGELLCEKLKEFNLGVETQLVESVDVKPEWFSKL
ncbi:MAG: restriction endonuclease [Lewinellaceae bacterium]|nr:restriction endonuclease [Saprospiraceae bacterium]MCB9339753.1 restriction endonuclease [Lewinellaceae bacterium]